MRPVLSLLALVAAAGSAAAQPARPTNLADAVVNLRTPDGVALVRGQWRYSHAHIIQVAHHDAGPDNKPSGPANTTNDISPHAGAADFDDSSWPLIDPSTLEARRGPGRLSFCWYRLAFTIPDRIGAIDTAGGTIAFELVMDDYAEVWVDGKLPQVLGQAGGPLIAGWNSPNRVVVTTDAQPGQQVRIAIFAANGPLSEPPANYIWMRSATLDFYKPGRWNPTPEVETTITRLDPALDRIIAPGTRLHRLATGFTFIEGPVWVRDAAAGDYLLFSEPNANVIHRWTPSGSLSVFRTKSGYTGADIGEFGQPGSNGLTLDREGRLTIDEHGNHRVTRLEKNGALTVLADSYQGKRLNSPNDLVYRSDGTLFFTDPPFGLPKFHADPRKELPFEGIYCLYNGQLKLLSTDLTGPNGIAFSPDEKHLYVTNWDPKKKVIMRYECGPDGMLSNGRVFFDMGSAPGDEALDGLKIDQEGNLYASGPGGMWIINAAGKQLGLVTGPELAANFAWGDDDGKTLYLTARTGLYRLRLGIPGIRP